MRSPRPESGLRRSPANPSAPSCSAPSCWRRRFRSATGYVLTQCYSVDVLSSLRTPPKDCFADWGMNIGRHCFSDYAVDRGPRDAAQSLGALRSPAGLIVPGGRNDTASVVRASREMAGRAAAGADRLSACADDRALFSRGLGGPGSTRSRAGGGVRGVGRRGHPGVGGDRSGQLGRVRRTDRAGFLGGVVPTAVGSGHGHGGTGRTGETTVRRTSCRVVCGPAVAVGRPRPRRHRGLQCRRLSAVATGLSGDNHTVDPQRTCFGHGSTPTGLLGYRMCPLAKRSL